MSFPAHKFIEKRYRNDIEQVAQFFDSKHPKSYFIYNMSNREMETSHFHEQVKSFEWKDHHSPALEVLFESCNHMFEFLMKSGQEMRNIVVVNCNAGKGRTGTSISCFLLFSGLFTSFIDAMTFYGWKRFINGRGVTQPSQ